ncbi:MAG: hypothetical protein ACR2NS_13840 [Gemmatimonadaceae bacterium]
MAAQRIREMHETDAGCKRRRDAYIRFSGQMPTSEKQHRGVARALGPVL